MLTKNQIEEEFRKLQDSICRQIEACDGGTSFRSDTWERPGGGGGDSRVIRNGQVIEKGGVNFSAVHGETPAKILEALKLPEARFYATGVSIVLHPSNPHVPIIHMNVRYFEMDTGHWWFGGGIDLTPHYVVPEDAHYFHRQLKEVCDRHGEDYYDRFKKWADDYFFLKHRQETRGIGGIFFDRLAGDKSADFRFVMDVGASFAPLYIHFMNKYRDAPFSENESHWQAIRRGRYVEFNLVWDKGTKFGLDTDGRTESILMSMPPMAEWEYDYSPKEGSREAETLRWLRKDIEWTNPAEWKH